MLKEGPAPMTTYKTCTETVLLGREVGGDEGEDVQREAIDANERVLPLINNGKCGRQVPVELTNFVQAGAAEEVSTSLFDESRIIFHNAPGTTRHTCQLFVQSKNEL